MPRLASRDKFPPGEFQVLHPEAGMRKPFTGSFRECVDFEMAFRTKNKSLAQSLGLPMDAHAVEVWVDEQNAIRCIANGWINFVIVEEGASRVTQKKTLLGAAAAGFGSASAAASAWSDMFGTHGPVSMELAERRAAVCADCTHNDTKNGLYAYFVKGAADKLVGILGALKDVNLRLKQPSMVGVCKLCLCPLNAKCLAQPEVLRQKLPTHVHTALSELTTPCWIKQELGL